MAQANQMQNRWNKLKSEMLDLGYSEADYNTIANQINNMYDNYGLGDYFFQDKGNSEYTVTGSDPYRLGMNLITKHETGAYDPKRKWTSKMLTYLDSVGTNPLTLDEVKASQGKGMKVSQNKKTGQWQTVIYGPDGPSDEDKITITWKQDPLTGKYSVANTNSYVYSAPKKDNMMGDLATLAAIAAAVYTGGASLGAWGGAEAAVAAAESAITEGYLAGTITADAASTALNTIYTNAGIFGGTTAGGAGMDFTDILGDSWDTADWNLSDIGGDAWDFGPGNIADGFTDPVSGAFMDQWGNVSTGLTDAQINSVLESAVQGNFEAANSVLSGVEGGSGFLETLKNLYNKLPSGTSNILKSLFNSGAASNDILSLLGQLAGNNMLSNSTSDIVGDWLDEIKGASPYSKEQRGQLADRSVELLLKDYLAPEFDNLMGQYESRGANTDQFAGMMNDAYTDPLSNPFVSSLMDSASNKALRAAGANGRLGGGGLEADMYNAMMSGAMPYLQQGTQHLGTLYQGQNVPINMINALNQANATSWQGGVGAGNVANNQQNAIAGFVQNVAAPAELITNPVGTGLQTIYGNKGKNNANSTFGGTY